ncbi:hypothetical protein UPYG_G00244290 [Umbra pygmaea]|uniref:C-type lectin domain-containing protein n=1 Tax=Umbra pygmaea TaxID=75934 RepID=A0ABD0WY97_UMBPY
MSGLLRFALMVMTTVLHSALGAEPQSPSMVITMEMKVGVEPQSPCPAGWHQNGHQCFSFYPVWATWTSAESSCSQHGGNLASVHSPDQQVFIQNLVKRHTDEPVWIGGYDAAQEGVWLWSDGSTFDDFHWEKEEPNNHGDKENCMELHTEEGRGWNDASCKELKFYVCSMRTRSDVAALPSQKKTHQSELAEGVSLFDVLWSTSETVAEETLHTTSAFLRQMRVGHLPVQRYTNFCQQEALFLDRVLSMLQVLIKRVPVPEDIKLVLQKTQTLYEEYLTKHRQMNVSSIQPSAAVRQYLQSFHDVVNEEPIYWVVSLLPRALLRPYLAQHIPQRIYTKLSLFSFPCPDNPMNPVFGPDEQYGALLKTYQDRINIWKAVNIFRVQMIKEKALFKSGLFPTGDEEEWKPSSMKNVESGPDLRVKLVAEQL